MSKDQSKKHQRIYKKYLKMYEIYKTNPSQELLLQLETMQAELKTIERSIGHSTSGGGNYKSD